MKDLAVGVVDSIRGNSRLRNSRCLGAYNHGGATPQEIREDAVIATSDLVMRVHRKWKNCMRRARTWYSRSANCRPIRKSTACRRCPAKPVLP